MSDLYKEAAEWGLKKAYEEDSEEPFMDRVSYWVAWWSARRASDALLIKAKELGLTDEQCEALRAVAADVAYD